MKAVILAGGLGTRLLPYTMFMPKPMLPLGGRPILEHLVQWTRKNEIKSVVMCVSYMAKAIEDHFGDGSRFGMNIEYAVSKKPLGTAGQLKAAQKFINGSFVCMYGDSIYHLDLKKMIRLHQKSKSFVTMGLYKQKTRLQYGVIKTTPAGRVTRWDEKPDITTDINIGCYVMESGIFDMIPSGRCGMDHIIRDAISRKKRIGSFESENFTDIGDKQSYMMANAEYLRSLGSA